MKCIEDEIPFVVPDGWAWARLKHICMMSAGKAKPSDQINPEPFEGCYPCFGGNGIRGYVDDYNQNGTFSIVGRQGALCGNINIASGKFYATEHAVVTTLFDGIDFNWSNYTLEALRLNEYATGAAQPGLSVANVLNVFVPVPPTQEQIYIGHQIAKSINIIENIADEKEDLQTLISVAKSKILDLAIRGKLVPQDSNDEPASVLLKRIRAEKEELIKQGKIKRDKNESIIFRGNDNSYYEIIDEKKECVDDDIPFEIPDNWEWARLSSIVQVLNGDRGQNYPAKSKLQDSGIPFVSASNIDSGKVVTNNLLCMTEEQYNALGAGKLTTGDIVYCIRGSLGKCGVFTMKEGAIASSLVIVRPIINDTIITEYIFNYLNSELSKKESSKYDNGSAQPNLAAKDFMKFLVPVPPLSEQALISSKLQEIYSYAIQIEKEIL